MAKPAKSSLQDPSHALTKLLPGEVLFREGELGHTMFVIASGKLELRQKKGATDGKIVTLNPGQIVGEKALLAEGTYLRKHTVVAIKESVVIGVDRKSIGRVHEVIPDFPLRLLSAVIQRLDKANQLNEVLMIRHPAERIVGFLIFQSQHYGEKVGEEISVELLDKDIEYSLHLEDVFVELVLSLLSKKNLLRVQGNTLFLASENALQAALPAIKIEVTEERLAELRKLSRRIRAVSRA